MFPDSFRICAEGCAQRSSFPLETAQQLRKICLSPKKTQTIIDRNDFAGIVICSQRSSFVHTKHTAGSISSPEKPCLIFQVYLPVCRRRQAAGSSALPGDPILLKMILQLLLRQPTEMCQQMISPKDHRVQSLAGQQSAQHLKKLYHSTPSFLKSSRTCS